MQEILPQIESVTKLCYAATPTEGPCRYSDHVLRVPCEDGVLLYQTLTGELLLLSKAEAEAAPTDPTLRPLLEQRRFLVPTAFDEYTYACQFRTVAALLHRPQPEITSFTIFTTTDCNARCPYCYEMGRPRRPMRDDTARDAAAYIARVSGGKKVKLGWFGGEPLMNARAIGIITEELRARGVPFYSTMITNGYLLDEQTVEKAKSDWHLERVQITLDGTEEAYNRIKGYVRAQGSAYRRVLMNIERLLQADVRVAIRLNATPQNMDDLGRLTDELAVRFAGQKKLSLYSFPVWDFDPDGAEPEPETVARWDALQRRILASGVGRHDRLSRQIRTVRCMADNDNCVTILPDGQLGKCEHETERLLIGSIYDGVTDPDMVAQWKERVAVPACKTCVLLPQCILLTKCAWSNGRCTEINRAFTRLRLEQKVLGEYRHFLQTRGQAEESEPEEDQTEGLR